jgi:hypothetical protein
MRMLKKYESFIKGENIKENIEENEHPIDTPEISDDVREIVKDAKEMQRNPHFMENERLTDLIEKLKSIDLNDAAEVDNFCEENKIDSVVYKQVLAELNLTESLIFEEVGDTTNIVLAAISALILAPEVYNSINAGIGVVKNKLSSLLSRDEDDIEEEEEGE